MWERKSAWEYEHAGWNSKLVGKPNRKGNRMKDETKKEIRLEIEQLEERIAPSANGQLGYEGQPGNQGNGLQGYEGQPGNQGG
jgi:hypothetical protein